MELQLYLRMLWRGWWIIALTALAALNIALAVSYQATPMYRTSARLIVSPNVALISGDREMIDSLEALDKRSIISTYAEMLDSNRIYSEAAASLQIDLEDLRNYTRSTVVLPDASILELSIEGPDPQISTLLANTVGQQAIDYITGLYQVYEIDFIDPATVPTRPFSPDPVRDAGLALALGLVVGAVLALLRAHLLIPLEAFQKIRMIDSVSSVYTRRYFLRQLEKELAQNNSEALSLGLIQLDGLRDLIETLPQAVIQRLLRQVTKTLQRELRGSDIVGRWDDTIFAVLLPFTPGTAATRTLERVRQALSEPFELDRDGEFVLLQPHIGATTRRGNDPEPASVLVVTAEAALERAGQQNTKTVLFPANMQQATGQLATLPDQVDQTTSRIEYDDKASAIQN